ncbi:MAG: hypothetical protein ABIH23_20535 [bacterium]
MTNRFLMSALLIVCAAIGVDEMAKAEEPAVLSAEQISAVILCDDFNGDQWGQAWNSDWIQDKNLRVYCEDGKLRVTGVSGDPVPVCKDHHEFRFSGLVSKRSTARDVVLACKMEVLSELPKGQTRARYLVHLCGASPDYFLDTGLAYEPDGREGWLHVPIAEGYPFSHDHKYPFIPLDQIPPNKEYTIVIDHNASTKLTRGYVVDGDTWHSLGEHRVFLSTTQVEIKVDVPYDGVKVDVAYDDARIYLRPENAPVRFVLIKPPFPGFPFPNAIVTFSDKSGAVVAKGQTDRDGEALLVFPSNRLYPMDGTVKITYEGDLVGIAEIDANGVQGLYPGDVWKIRAPEKYKFEGKGYPMGM